VRQSTIDIVAALVVAETERERERERLAEFAHLFRRGVNLRLRGGARLCDVSTGLRGGAGQEIAGEEERARIRSTESLVLVLVLR